MSTPIVWMSDPRDGYVLDSLSPRLLCYDCMDDYALIAPQAALRGVLRSQEEGLLKRVDVVFASSDELARRCTSSNRNVHLVPNGVDAARFAPASGAAIAPDVAALPRPRLGYAGSLASWIDFDLLAMIARARPQWSLVLVGPVASDAQAQVAALQRLPNVHVLGERPYRAIPTYLHGFDVSLIPFQINDLTRAVNPVKFFEYIAAGQPVVATPLPELLRFQETCAIAASGDDFIACIESALSTRDDGERVRQRLAFAQANDWSQRVDSVRAALALALQSAGV
jgi:glycosyltransferase involved in cell wall biosynthesis